MRHLDGESASFSDFSPGLVVIGERPYLDAFPTAGNIITDLGVQSGAAHLSTGRLKQY